MMLWEKKKVGGESSGSEDKRRAFIASGRGRENVDVSNLAAL